MSSGISSGTSIEDSLKVNVWDTTTLLNSLLNSRTLKSTMSPLFSLDPSSFSICLLGQKAEISSLKFIIAPLSIISETFELWMVSIAKSFS